jgi:hypothetical protein
VYRSHAQAKLVDSLRRPVPLDCQQAFFRARAMNARFEQAAASSYPPPFLTESAFFMGSGL